VRGLLQVFLVAVDAFVDVRVVHAVLVARVAEAGAVGAIGAWSLQNGIVSSKVRRGGALSDSQYEQWVQSSILLL